MRSKNYQDLEGQYLVDLKDGRFLVATLLATLTFMTLPSTEEEVPQPFIFAKLKLPG